MVLQGGFSRLPGWCHYGSLGSSSVVLVGFQGGVTMVPSGPPGWCHYVSLVSSRIVLVGFCIVSAQGLWVLRLVTLTFFERCRLRIVSYRCLGKQHGNMKATLSSASVVARVRPLGPVFRVSGVLHTLLNDVISNRAEALVWSDGRTSYKSCVRSDGMPNSKVGPPIPLGATLHFVVCLPASA